MAYLALYACGYSGTGSLQKFDGLAAASLDTAFLARLDEQVQDRRIEPGWIVTGWDDLHVFLERDGVRTFATRTLLSDDQFQLGRTAALSMRSISPGEMPGFVVRHGVMTTKDRPISRLYINLRPEEARWALGPLAQLLDSHHLPFQVKVLAHPRAYLRRDACVLYVPSDQLTEAFELVHNSVSTSSVSLLEPVPLFTKQLARGIGFADDPSELDMGEQSHGQWVSSLFVMAAADAADPPDIARAVVELIRSCGRDPEQPYLRASRLGSDTQLAHPQAHDRQE